MLNSCGTNAYGDSRMEHGHDDRGGRKLSEYEYSVHGWASCCRGAVASLQQAPGSVHDEAWAGRVPKLQPRGFPRWWKS